MEPGYMLDRDHGGGAKPAQWTPGIPEKGFFAAFKLNRKRVKRDVITYRCPRCGILQAYALGL